MSRILTLSRLNFFQNEINHVGWPGKDKHTPQSVKGKEAKDLLNVERPSLSNNISWAVLKIIIRIYITSIFA